MFYRNLDKKGVTSATFTDKSALVHQSEKTDKKMNISFFFDISSFFPPFPVSPLHMLERLD